MSINRATDWEQGRTILKIGGLLVRHGFREDPTWSMIDYYWHGRIFMTSARWYVVFWGDPQRMFILEQHDLKFQVMTNGVKGWR